MLAVVAGAGIGALPGLSRADAFPSKPLRLVVPFPPGGPTDIVARPMAQMLGEALKQNVIIDNRGGAGGSIGADVVAKAAPDGYTLLMGTVGTSAINAALYSKLPHDPVKDFTPIALVASAPVDGRGESRRRRSRSVRELIDRRARRSRASCCSARPAAARPAT